jgi:intracellular sulfur oxidation DsrE/DsrF family protein
VREAPSGRIVRKPSVRRSPRLTFRPPAAVSETPRRDFLSQLAAAGLATAGLSAIGGAALAQPAAGSGAGSAAPKFDDSWTARVRGARHKAVFDAPEVQDGLGLWQAWLFRRGYREALGPAEAEATVPVVVIRHAATVLAIDDALWAKYKLGEMRKLNDPVTKKPAERNPFARPLPDAPKPEGTLATMLEGQPEPNIQGLLKEGALVLACNVALENMIGAMAKRSGQTVEAIRAETHAHLVPGVILQPSGVYAVLRAQEAGCVYLRSTNVA